MLQYTLKPGAHNLLFTPELMALQGKGNALATIAAAQSKANQNQNQNQRQTFPRASGNEGNLPGYIGVKSESAGPFSLTAGNSDASHLLLQLLVDRVDDMADLARANANNTANTTSSATNTGPAPSLPMSLSSSSSAATPSPAVVAPRLAPASASSAP